MHFLLTNDDGIDAPGLAALAAAVSDLAPATWVAPQHCHSGCGHRVTTEGPLRFERRDAARWAIAGTPADCVRLGLARLVPEVTWVLSGLNEGGNLGADVFHSGTVAAVREAALHGKPGIALSHYRKRNHEIDWGRAARWMRPIVAELLRRPLDAGAFWNINLPHVSAAAPDPDVVFCPLDNSPLPLAYRDQDGHLHYSGNYHERARKPGCDVDVCFRGQIAVSLLRV